MIPTSDVTGSPVGKRARAIALALVVAFTAVSGAALAQAADPAVDARRHFQQAIALYNDNNFEAALAEFKGAYDAKPAASILYNIGLTYKALFLYNDSIRALEQYLGEETKLAPERRAEVQQILREMRALLADVTLTIGPDRAYVKLDGRAIGQAPIGHYLIPAGRHVIDVSADGYTSQTKELMVTAGVPLSITMALAIVPRTGRVRVQVSPAGASVKLDKVVYPPPIDVELPLGGHTLEAWATGYQVHREEILIAAGQTREVYVSLRKPPIYKRAALWVPLVVGLVVVGGVAAGLGVYYGTRDDRITGTLAPGQATVGR